MSAALGAAPAGAPSAAPPRARGEDAVARHVRGSSVMLAGRLLAMLVGFVTQVLIVRHLTKADYGSFAYALSAVLLLQSVLPLGLDRADTRFLALYDERRDPARVLGVILLEALTVLVLGGLAIAAAWTFREPLEASLASRGATVTVLLAMLALAPLQALDVLLLNVFAVFADPWSIFVRRYVLEPGLKLLVVLVMVAQGHGVLFLTLGYVAAGVLGLLIYGALLVRLLIRRGILTRAAARARTLPVREAFAFGLPLLLTNVVAVASTELAAVVLGHYRPAAEVAAFRAVQPFAALNLVVMFSFTTLFTPAAARFCARDDVAGLRRLYWQSACWVAALTFPVLCLTTALAHPLAVTALGERYAGSAAYLALLSVGYYLNAALGFNGLTVQLLGRLRYVVASNLVVLALMLALDLLLIPRWGATGAVVAVLATLVAHNLLKQAGLGFGAGIGMVDRRHALVLGQLVAVAVALNLLAALVEPPLVAGLVLVAGTTLLMLRRLAPVLELASTFPELAVLDRLAWRGRGSR